MDINAGMSTGADGSASQNMIVDSVSDSGTPNAKRMRVEDQNLLNEEESRPSIFVDRAHKAGLWKLAKEYKRRCERLDQDLIKIREAFDAAQRSANHDAKLWQLFNQSLSKLFGSELTSSTDPSEIAAAVANRIAQSASGGNVAAFSSWMNTLGNVTGLEGQIKELKEKCDVDQASISELEDSRVALERHIDRLELELDRYKVASKSAVSASKQTEKQKSPVDGSFQDHTDQSNGEIRTTVDEAKYALLEKELAEVRQALAAASQLADSRLSDIERIDALRVSLVTENDKLKAVFSVFGSGDLQDLQSVASLHFDLRRLRSELSGHVAAFKELEKQMNARDDATRERIAQLTASENGGAGNSASLKQFVDAMEAEAARMRKERDAMREAYEKANGQVASAVKLNTELQEMIKGLKTQCAAFKAQSERVAKLEVLCNPIASSPDNAELAGQIQELKDQESALYEEMESLGKAFGDAQQRCDVLSKQLAEKDEAYGRLVAEKMRMDFAIVQARKECEIANQKASALERASLERIADAERRDRSSFERIAELESKLQRRMAELEGKQLRISEITEQAALQRAQLERYKAMNLETLLEERTKEAALAARERDRCKEELSALERKMQLHGGRSLSSKNGTAGNASLAGLSLQDLTEQVALYKQLLKCNSCHTNNKDTIITKCMHTFCRQCVDHRLETRQRKCPNCSTSFGAGDVHPLFF